MKGNYTKNDLECLKDASEILMKSLDEVVAELYKLEIKIEERIS